MYQRFAGITTGLFMIVFGGVFAGVAWLAMAEAQPYDDGVTTTAGVVGVVEGSVIIDGIARPNYAPVYEFDAVDGERYRITDHVTASTSPVPVGTTVEVSYQPDDPTQVRRTDVDWDWLWWFVIGGVPIAAIGTLVLAASLVSTIRQAFRRRNAGGPGGHLPGSSPLITVR